MKTLFLIISISASITLLSACTSPTEKTDAKDAAMAQAEKQKKVDDLDQKLKQVKESYNLPSYQAWVIDRNEVMYQKIDGLRDIEKPDSTVTAKDVYYFGKNSRIITAILTAQLVDLKVLQWTTQLHEIVGKDFAVNAKLKNITLEMLLNQSSGLVSLDKLKVMSTLDKYSTRRARALIVQSLLSYDPQFEPGTRTDTSASSYVVLGWILEKYTNFAWEELVKNKIFIDLGMNSCFFGTQNIKNNKTLLLPLGHTLRDFKTISVSPSQMDVPAAIASAEGLYCSPEDFVKLLKEINLGLYRESSLLQENTFVKLFSSGKDPKLTHAHFQTHERVWAGGQALTSVSLDTFYTSYAVLAPSREMILVVVVNSGTPKAREGAAKILKLLTEFVQ